jgi:hypothetical protein
MHTWRMIMDLSSGHSINNSSSDKLYQATKKYFSPTKLWEGKKVSDKLITAGVVISYGTVALPIIMKGIELGINKYHSSQDLHANLHSVDSKTSEKSILKANEHFRKVINSSKDYSLESRASTDEKIFNSENSSHEKASNDEHNYFTMMGIKFVD